MKFKSNDKRVFWLSQRGQDCVTRTHIVRALEIEIYSRIPVYCAHDDATSSRLLFA